MIAAHKELSQPARAFDDFIGAGAVADDVAEIDHHVVSGGRRQARFQSFEIAMNIAYQKNAH